MDLARSGDEKAQAKVDFLTPIVKSWCTDMACAVTSTGVQIHGGMGFIEETGAAQFYRDARILPIYEGTNGIQAADLCFRKIARDSGKTAFQWIADGEGVLHPLRSANGDDMEVITDALKDGLMALTDITQWIVDNAATKPEQVSAVSVPALQAFGIVSGGVMMARAALAAKEALANGEGHDDLLHAKISHARYYAQHIIPYAQTHAHMVLQGARSITTVRF